MIDTKQIAKYIFEEYAICYSEVDIENLAKHLDEIKAEAIKQFAERLKENKIDIDVSFGYGREVYTEAVAVIEIENLVKETVGDDG